MSYLAAFSLTIFHLSISISALFLPQKLVLPEIAKECTFMLWHKQIINLTKTNYIQLHQIYDNTNNVVIDVLESIPITAHNSYFRISATQVFAVEGLLDGTNLTIKGEDGSDEVRCENDGILFSTDKSMKDALCIPGPWDIDTEIWTGSRVKSTFPGVLQ
jgi:hypothetical protein